MTSGRTPEEPLRSIHEMTVLRHRGGPPQWPPGLHAVVETGRGGDTKLGLYTLTRKRRAGRYCWALSGARIPLPSGRAAPESLVMPTEAIPLDLFGCLHRALEAEAERCGLGVPATMDAWSQQVAALDVSERGR